MLETPPKGPLTQDELETLISLSEKILSFHDSSGAVTRIKDQFGRTHCILLSGQAALDLVIENEEKV